jgi:hypothetical protein
MTIKTSGPLSITEINAEFSLGNNLNVYRGVKWYKESGVSGNFSTGAISMFDFYGTTPKFSGIINISANTSDYSLYNALVGIGWNTTTAVNVVVTVNAGVVIYSSSVTGYAFDVTGLPAGSYVKLVNNGWIVGRGGKGIGRANSTDNGVPYGFGLDYFPPFAIGGTGLRASVPLYLDNTNGVIGGGGGAGGAGGSYGGDCRSDGNCGIGCGGFGISGGGGGFGTAGYSYLAYGSCGQFGPGGYNDGRYYTFSNAGGQYDAGAGVGYGPGASGTLGVAGANGVGGGCCGNGNLGATAGAPAGKSISGYSNIIVLGYGTVYGATS